MIFGIPILRSHRWQALIFLAVTLGALVVTAACSTPATRLGDLPAAGKSRAIDLSQSLAEDLHIKTEEVRKQLLATNLHVTGQIHPEFGKEVSVSPRVPGRVVEILVTPGEHVAAGQNLAMLDSQQVSDLQAELIEALSQLGIAQACEERERQVYEEQLRRPKSLIEARSRFEEAKVQLELTEKELNRVEELRKAEIAAAKDLNVAQAGHDKAQTLFHQAKSDLQREQSLFQNKAMMRRDYQMAEAETRRAQQHLKTLRQRLLFLGMTAASLEQVIKTGKIVATVPIKAPVAGLITHQEIALGEMLESGKQALVVSDLSTVALSADIAEVDVSNLSIGMPVKATVTGYPDKVFTGNISYISTHVNPESRTVAIRARLKNSDLKLKASMFAETDIELSPHMVLTCPKCAVLERDARKIVYLASGHGFEEHFIKVGRANERYYEVISGLTEGDRVVTAGSLLLKTESTGGV